MVSIRFVVVRLKPRLTKVRKVNYDGEVRCKFGKVKYGLQISQWEGSFLKIKDYNLKTCKNNKAVTMRNG